MHFYGLQLDGETFHPEFWHIHVADLPLTVFSTGVSEAPTEAEDKEKQEAIRSRAAAKDISIDAKLFMSFLQLEKMSTKEKMLCLQP